jgi:hypothetical protein
MVFPSLDVVGELRSQTIGEADLLAANWYPASSV